MFLCTDCGLRYEVVWNYDGHEPPCGYCPRCGCSELESDESDDTEVEEEE